MLVVGRFINGLSVGICSAQGPVFIAELSTPARRGLVVGTQQWAITWGILIMFYLSYGCSFLEGTRAFRFPWGLQAIPGLLLFAALFFVPESPRWLAYKDRWEDCHQVLTMVHAKGDLNHPFVELELQELKETCEFDRNSADHSVFELFQGKMLWRAHIGIFTQIWSQLSGINVIMYCKCFRYLEPICHIRH
jgi:MFS family permease